MNQEEAQQEFDTVRQQREECLEWLEQNEAHNELFSNNNDDNDAHQHRLPVPLNPPSSVQQSILGRPPQNYNEQDASEEVGAGNNGNEPPFPHEHDDFEQQPFPPPDHPLQQNWDTNNEPWMLRSLHPQELNVLYAHGRCRCRDWSNIYLYLPRSLCPGEGPNNHDHLHHHRAVMQHTCLVLQQRLLDVGLAGTVILVWPQDPQGNAEEPEIHSDNHNDNQHGILKDWEWLPQGIYQTSMICNSIVSLDAWIYRNSLISNTVIGSKAVVMNVGKLVATTTTMSLYSHQTITVGPEAGGGRDVRVTPQSTMVDVGVQLTNPETTKSTKDDETPPLQPAVGSWSVVSSHTILRDTTTVDSVYLHPHSAIEGASCVQCCVLFPTSHIGHGCRVAKAFLQWNCTIQDQSYVDTVMMMEGCHIGPHSKVGDAILGPDVALGSGEVQSSVLGPNTAAHHQSLCIAHVALHGRGNVGYGANVGSNHTGRAPDQEAWGGEGVFWGLSTAVVYPVNLLASPYSIVAAGTKLVPQSLAMPFSLLLNDGEIVPGWVWTSSPYTLARCQQKWETRRKALRHYHYTGWEMIHRKDVLQHVYRAREILRNLSSPGTKDVNDERWYNDKGNDAVSGLGLCRVSEKSRRRAVQAYSDCLQQSCLLGLIARLEESLHTCSVAEAINLLRQELQSAPIVEEEAENEASNHYPGMLKMPWAISSKETWSYQKFLLVKEFGRDLDCMELLRTRLVELQEQFATAVYKSKQRDDQRGAHVIPGYKDCHESADNDKTILQVQKATRMVKERISLLGKRLKMEEN